MQMPISEARKRANKKSDAAHWEYCTVKVHKGRKAEIEAAAKSIGMSRNKFVTEAIDEKIEKISKSPEKDVDNPQK